MLGRHWDDKHSMPDHRRIVPPIFSYHDALDRVRSVLVTYGTTPINTPITAELEDAIRLAVNAARRDRLALPAVAADLARLTALALPGDVRAIEVGRALASYAARAYHAPNWSGE
jgi:hypothetical protein